jgi:hypothetical protein
MRPTIPSTAGSLASLADDAGLQVAVVATGLAAVVAGIGWQVVWLLVVTAVVVNGLVGAPSDSTGPDGGGNGGGGGTDRPLDPTSVPPVGVGVR